MNKGNRTIFDKVTEEIYDRIEANNFNLTLYGEHSVEYAVAKIQLNSYMDALEDCGYIAYYYYDHGNGGFINDVVISMSIKTYRVMKGEFE